MLIFIDPRIHSERLQEIKTQGMTINLNPQIWENSFGYKVNLDSHRQLVKSREKVIFIFIFIDQQIHSERLQEIKTQGMTINLNPQIWENSFGYKVNLCSDK